jgi:hypothetical protein
MGHILRDFFAGTAIVVLGMVLSLAAFVILFIFGIFFKVLTLFTALFFFLFLFFFTVWLIGFLFRKVRETNKK